MATLVSNDGPSHSESNFNSDAEAIAQAREDLRTGQREVVKIITDEGNELLPEDIKED